MTSPASSVGERVLELSGVGRRFGSDPAVDALVDVDLRLDRGDWLAVTGPSGAGKSTLLHIMGCLDHPTSGSYLLDDIETTRLSDKERAGLRSRRIGFVFQSFHLMPYRTVLENVMLAEVYRRQPLEGRRERALAALERVGLGHRVDFLPRSSRAASASAWRSPAPSWAPRACCCATSRRETSTRARPSPSSICSRS